MLRQAYLFLITVATLIAALAALFFFVTMNRAHAETVLAPVRANNHYGSGMLRTYGGEPVPLTSFSGVGNARSVTVKQGEHYGVNYATEMVPPWTNKYIEIESSPFKVLIYFSRFNMKLKTGTESTYIVLGKDMKPPQKFNMELNAESKDVSAGEYDRFGRRRRCSNGKYYQLVERQYKIQKANIKLFDASNKTLASIDTGRVRTAKEVSLGSTPCSEHAVNPYERPPIMQTGVPTSPAAR